MLKQTITVASALVAICCGGSLAFAVLIVVTRFVFDMRVLTIMVSLTAGMIVAVLVACQFYRLAVKDGGFSLSRMVGIAIGLIAVVAIVTLLYGWIIPPVMALADRKPMMALGIALVAVPCLLAYPVNYLLNVRNTTAGGVVEVNGLLGYLGHGLANLAARLILGGSALVGMLMIFAVGLFG